MSEFGEAMFNLLPEHSALRNSENLARLIIDKTVGEWFDNHETADLYVNLFITQASGKYLDLFGKDYGVYRKNDESDDDYRIRIVQEKQDYLTPLTLSSLFSLDLYVYVDDFSSAENSLTSDNPYLDVKYMCWADSDIREIVDKKFILEGDVITWL